MPSIRSEVVHHDRPQQVKTNNNKSMQNTKSPKKHFLLDNIVVFGSEDSVS